MCIEENYNNIMYVWFTWWPSIVYIIMLYLSLDVSKQHCLHPLHWLYEVGAAVRRGRAAAAVVHGNHSGQVGPQLS